MRPTGPGPLVALACAGLVAGFSVRLVCDWLNQPEPVISVMMLVVVWLLAIGTAVHALLTHRAQGRGTPIEPHRAVNRLMLGKASALVGALLLGGYSGFAIAHIGVPQTELSDQRLQRAIVGALAAAAWMLAGLALERACRIRDHDDFDDIDDAAA